MSATLAIITSLVGPISSLLDKFIPDKDMREKLAHEIATKVANQSHEIALAQIDVNKEEARNHSVFISGWRPATGWCCTLALGTNYILIPILGMFGVTVVPFDFSVMSPILLGMLGLTAARTMERHSNVHRTE